MCYYPRFIKNPRYRVSKGKYDFGAITDWRMKYVPIGCGECYECRKQKAQGWRIRLIEEMKVRKYAQFITLTFSNEEYIKLSKELECTSDNAITTAAVRRFLERWRKKYGKSVCHWLITELGQDNTERIHLHGIIFRDDQQTTIEELTKLWKYGKADIGEYCNLQTINYIVKYVTKIDIKHKHYKAIILNSAGIGKAFTETIAAKNTYKYKPHESIEYYTLPNGYKVALPIYYRNKMYTEEERLKLWSDRLDKHIIFVDGIKIRNMDTNEAQTYYNNLLISKQAENKEAGYGSTDKEWKKYDYNHTLKMINNSNFAKSSLQNSQN